MLLGHWVDGGVSVSDPHRKVSTHTARCLYRYRTRANAGPPSYNESRHMTSTPNEANTSGPNYANPVRRDRPLLFGILVDRWVLIVGTTALFGLGGIFMLSVVPVFQADALVQVEEEKQGLDVAAMPAGTSYGWLHYRPRLRSYRAGWCSVRSSNGPVLISLSSPTGCH